MRIGISGAHGTGKTTLAGDLCEHLAGHVTVDEPYLLLEEEGYEFEFPPSLEDYRAQLGRSLRLLRSSASRVVFDRTPLDFLAYLAAQGAEVEGEADPSALRSALASLDLLIVTPVTPEIERVLPRPGMPRLREMVNDTLLDLLSSDPLQAWADVPVIELSGPLDGRLEAVLAVLPAHSRSQARPPGHGFSRRTR
jgi:AAA domain